MSRFGDLDVGAFKLESVRRILLEKQVNMVEGVPSLRAFVMARVVWQRPLEQTSQFLKSNHRVRVTLSFTQPLHDSIYLEGVYNFNLSTIYQLVFKNPQWSHRKSELSDRHIQRVCCKHTW